MRLLSDRSPFLRKADLAPEVWLTVPVAWARGIYSTGAAAIGAAMPTIEAQAHAAYGDRWPRVLERRFRAPGRSMASIHIRRARRLQDTAERAAATLAPAVGDVALPAREVRALQLLESGATLAELCNPDPAAAERGSISDSEIPQCETHEKSGEPINRQMAFYSSVVQEMSEATKARVKTYITKPR